MGCHLRQFLAGLAIPEFESEVCFHSEGGLHPTFQNEATPHHVTSDPERLCKPSQKPVSLRGIVSSDKEVASRKRGCLVIPSLLQLVISSPETQHKWIPILDLSQLNLYLSPGTFKMETPETIRLSLQRGKWVTSLDFSNAYFHIPINQRSRGFS